MWEFIEKLVMENLGWCIIGSITLIQIAPINIDPWSKVGVFIKGILGITGIERRLDTMEQKADEKCMKELRAYILDFANSCRNKRRHTYSEFQEVDRSNTEYDNLVKKYGFENHFLTEEFAYIQKIFHRCQEENSFLEQINKEEEREEDDEKQRFGYKVHEPSGSNQKNGGE